MKQFQKMIVNALLLIAITSALCYSTYANDYPESMSFINVLQNKNIAIGETEAIVQDYQGFMWFGGNGALLRYDGYEYRHMSVQKDPQNPNSIEKIVSVIDLYEDRDNILWAATGSGLVKYDRQREIFLALQQESGVQASTYSARVNRVLEMPSGNLVAGAYGGLVIVDKKTHNLEFLVHTPGDPQSIADNAIIDMALDSENNLLLATHKGISIFNEETKQFKNYIPDAANPDSWSDNSGLAIIEDANGFIWFGVRNGLHKLNPKTGAVVRYRHNPNKASSLSADLVFDLYVDQEKRLWVATDVALSLYNPEKDNFIHYGGKEQSGGLADKGTRRFYQDRTGDFWVGTYPTGISFHDRSSAAFRTYRINDDLSKGLIGNDIGAILEDHSGNWWIGNGGVTRIDKDTGQFHQYLPSWSPESRIDTTSIISGLIDSDGDIWIGTWAKGLHRYNPKTDRFDAIPFDASLAAKRLKSTNKLVDAHVWSIYEDKRKNLWIGTHNGGLSRYDKNTGIFYPYGPDSNDHESIANELIRVSYEDSLGRFWIGTADGVDLMNREKGTFTHYSAYTEPKNGLPPGNILAILEDSKKRLWFGTAGGLCQFDSASTLFTCIGAEEGFGSRDVKSITEDALGRLWLGTGSGVVLYNPDTKEVLNYQTQNGKAIGQLLPGSALTTSSGHVLMGGVNGLRSFDVKNLQKNPNKPPIILSDFQIFTKSVPIAEEDSILSQSLSLTDSITLGYKKSMFSFTFSALNFRNPEKNQYAYKLEGFDEDWRNVGFNRTAVYTNLDAGLYNFRVKASNNDGLWNEQGISIQLKQLPPPWQTVWAYTAYALILMAFIAQIIYKQIKKHRLIEEQNRLLEQKVKERTQDLREKNQDIQAMLSNMRQGLFTIVSDGVVHHEYSQYLEFIFGRSKLAGEKVMTLLFDKSDLGEETLSMAEGVINSVIDEDEMNFEMNAHLLPLEYNLDINGHNKHLALDWSPIISDDVVIKLMVSVRDVTELRVMEKEAQGKQREMDILSQLLNIPAKKLLSYLENCKKFITQNRDILNLQNDLNQESIANLFRNMHTIKGNARTLGFNMISEVAHQAETLYSELQKDKSKDISSSEMLEDLDILESVLQEYDACYHAVLRRNNEERTETNELGFWGDEKMITTIHALFNAADQQPPEVQRLFKQYPIDQMVDQKISTPLDAVLKDNIMALPSLASELGKEPPSVCVEDHNIRIYNQSEELIVNVFTHLLRNSLDHGLEAPNERLAAGKSASGNIRIHAYSEGETLQIQIDDDGQGLNLTHLLAKGRESKVWGEDDYPSVSEIAGLIFSSGMSTNEEVTDISGRGVGMDAVKRFIEEAGGHIKLQFPPGVAEQRESIPEKTPFKLIVSLSKMHFYMDLESK